MLKIFFYIAAILAGVSGITMLFIPAHLIWWAAGTFGISVLACLVLGKIGLDNGVLEPGEPESVQDDPTDL